MGDSLAEIIEQSVFSNPLEVVLAEDFQALLDKMVTVALVSTRQSVTIPLDLARTYNPGDLYEPYQSS